MLTLANHLCMSPEVIAVDVPDSGLFKPSNSGTVYQRITKALKALTIAVSNVVQQAYDKLWGKGQDSHAHVAQGCDHDVGGFGCWTIVCGHMPAKWTLTGCCREVCIAVSTRT